MGAYCIDEDEAGAARGWFAASVACRDRDGGGAQGRRLCSASEWFAACEDENDGSSIGLNDSRDDFEWVDDWLDTATAMTLGNEDCAATGSSTPNTNRAYRCCQ